jgi:hypothetical protein
VSPLSAAKLPIDSCAYDCCWLRIVSVLSCVGALQQKLGWLTACRWLCVMVLNHIGTRKEMFFPHGTAHVDICHEPGTNMVIESVPSLRLYRVRLATRRYGEQARFSEWTPINAVTPVV